MLTVETFLCCFELETGGIILGWFEMICDVIAIILIAIFCAVLASANCNDISQVLQEHDIHVKVDECETLKIVVLIAFIVIILFLIGFAIIGYLLLSGTKRRDHIRIRPSVITNAVMGIAGFLYYLFKYGLEGILRGILEAIIFGVFQGYIFVVLYSLYVKIRNEGQRHPNAQYIKP